MKIKKTSLFLMAISAIFAFSSCNSDKTEQQTEETSKTEAKIEIQPCPMDAPGVLVIVASATIKNEADRDDVVKALYAVVDGTRTEEGNISYVLHQDINDPMTYIIIEAWKSQDAINFHNETPHFKALGEAIGDKAVFKVNTMRKVY